jgi:hypothetical protein
MSFADQLSASCPSWLTRWRDSIRKTQRYLAGRQTLGSRRRLQPLRRAHLPALQNHMSRAGRALLGLGQWEGEKEGRPAGGA